MRITILTWSTRGEVQPYMALAWELERRGHQVVVAVNENHVPWVRRAGLTVATLPLDFHALMLADSARQWFHAGETRTLIAWLSSHEHAHRHAIAAAMMDACSGADLIVSGFLVSHRAAAIAEAYDVPLVRAFMYPVAATTAYASPYLSASMPSLPRAELVLRSHRRAEAEFQKSQRPDLEELRADLGLSPLIGSAEYDLARRGVPTLHLFDERVLARPDDWPANLVVGGYCSLSRETRVRLGECGIEPHVEAWLRAGDAPILFCFGSTPVPDPSALLRLIAEVCLKLRSRAIVIAGWSKLSSAPTDDMLIVKSVDLDALSSRCRAAVHHGGAGTTASTLTAGTATVVCSILADQPLWGYRVTALGVGATLPFQRLTPARLCAALRRALEDDVRRRAHALGAELRATDGRGRAAGLLCDLAKPARASIASVTRQGVADAPEA